MSIYYTAVEKNKTEQNAQNFNKYLWPQKETLEYKEKSSQLEAPGFEQQFY